MDKSLLAVLNDAERLLIAETERDALADSDEDAVGALHGRVRTARNKYVALYRRQASAGVVEHASRGTARPKNQRAALKAEAFEEALARVSRRLAALARESAAGLRAERIQAARAEKSAAAAGSTGASGTGSPSRHRTVTELPTGDRSKRSAASRKNTASVRAEGARRQARRDSR